MRCLTAGPLTMLFDEPRAFLRHVSLGRQELIRGVFPAVRDRDWNTIAFTLTDLHVEQTDDQFTMRYLARCRDYAFQWHGDITGSPRGRIRYRFSGRALADLWKNRIGLCVLHPVEPCAGRPCRVEQIDGRMVEGVFPKWISPHQPFKQIAAITISILPGVDLTVRFQGEAFEMEDQRNWTDASYKTYSTPLELPFPAELKAQTRIEHTVTIELRGFDPAKISVPDARGRRAPPALAVSVAAPHAWREQPPVRVQVDWRPLHPLPAISLGMSTCAEPASPRAIDQVRELAPDHLRVDFDPDAADAAEQAREAIDLAGRTGARLEVALFLQDASSERLQRVAEVFHGTGDRLARWLVLHPVLKTTPAGLATTAVDALRRLAPEVPCVVGTNAYFAELNRGRPTATCDRLVCYSVNPQVHAFDNFSLCETLGALRWTVDSARQYFDSRVVVSPVTLLPRFNPNAASDSPDEGPSEPPTDPRQPTGFAAAWTVGVITALAGHVDVASLTFFETFGPRGVMHCDGTLWPVASVFRALHRGDAVCRTSVSAPLSIAALAVAGPSGARLIVGNLTPENRGIAVASPRRDERLFHVAAESVRVLGPEELA